MSGLVLAGNALNGPRMWNKYSLNIFIILFNYNQKINKATRERFLIASLGILIANRMVY